MLIIEQCSFFKQIIDIYEIFSILSRKAKLRYVNERMFGKYKKPKMKLKQKSQYIVC